MFLVLAACGGKEPTTGSGSGSDLRPTRVLDTRDPTERVVARAFGSRRPQLPLLSKDGNRAAVEIATPIGGGDGSTYSVGFVTPGADAWSGGEIELVTLVDGALVNLLAEDPGATYDVDSIAQIARGIADRIVDDGFRPFDGSFDAITPGEPVVTGPFRFKVTEEATGAITIVVEERGTKIATEQIQAVPTGHVAELECVARPQVKRAFSDTGRRRLLLDIGWSTNGPQCDTPDDKYRLVAPR